MFKSSVEEFLTSLQFLVEEKEEQRDLGKNLYPQVLPWVNTSFLWPEKNIDWEYDSNQYAYSKGVTYDAFDNDEYLITLVVTKSKSYIVESDMESLKKQTINQLKSEFYPSTLNITEKRSSSRELYICYD